MDTARDIPVREADVADAAALLELQLALDRQSSMMMLEVGERSTTEAEVLAHIRSVLARANSTILLAEVTRRRGFVEHRCSSTENWSMSSRSRACSRDRAEGGKAPRDLPACSRDRAERGKVA